MRTSLVLLAAGLVVGCGAANDKPSAEFIDLGGIGNYAMVVSKAVPADQLVDLAKDKCGREPMCSVHGWNEKAVAPRALPMTDAEVMAQVFSFTVNRNSGFERALWNCKVYARSDSDQCMATVSESDLSK